MTFIYRIKPPTKLIAVPDAPYCSLSDSEDTDVDIMIISDEDDETKSFNTNSERQKPIKKSRELDFNESMKKACLLTLGLSWSGCQFCRVLS